MRDIIKLISEEETNSHFEFIKQLSEKAPAGKKAHDFIKKAKPDFQDRYGDAWEQVLYATANKMFGKHHKKKKIKEAKIVYSNKNRQYNIYETPTLSELKSLLKNSKEKELRGFLFPNKIYIWDAFYFTHEQAKLKLWGDWKEIKEQGIFYDIYIVKSDKDVQPIDFSPYMLKTYPIAEKYLVPIGYNMRFYNLIGDKY